MIQLARKRKRRKIPHKLDPSYYYNQRLHNFEYTSKDYQLIEQFEKRIEENYSTFFDVLKQTLKKIKVNDTNLRSALRGKDRDRLNRLKETFTQQSSNNSQYKNRHQMKIFTIILTDKAKNPKTGTFRTVTTWQMLMNAIDDYLQLLQEELFTWNAVYYGNYQEGILSK